MLVPKKTKFKKFQKGKFLNKVASNKINFKYGQIGLKSCSYSRLSNKQLITLYNFLKKKTKKMGKVILKVFPHLNVSKKPTEIRMGKGKGNISHWIVKLSPGFLFCEIAVSVYFFPLILKALSNVRYRLPIKSKIIFRKI
jgi:large subunit ribosomal protein L16